MIDVPALTPDTSPLPELMVATPVVPLFHVPPNGVSLSDVVSPAQTDKFPSIADGIAFTVKIALTAQPTVPIV